MAFGAPWMSSTVVRPCVWIDLVRQHGRVEIFGIHEERRVDAHLAQIALEQLQIARIDPAWEHVELAVGRRLGRGDGLDDGQHALRVAADLAALEARRMHRHDVDLAARKLRFQRPVAVHDAALDVVADDLGRAGGDDGDHPQIGIAPGERHHALLDALVPAEHRRVLVQRGRGDVEVFLEVLGEQEPHEHRAALAAMNERDAVLDADAGILGAGRLAVVHRVDDACPFLASDFATHGNTFRMDWGRPASGAALPLSRASGEFLVERLGDGDFLQPFLEAVHQGADLRRAFLLDPGEALLEIGDHDLGVRVEQLLHRRFAVRRFAGQEIGDGLQDAVDILLPVPGP